MNKIIRFFTSSLFSSPGDLFRVCAVMLLLPATLSGGAADAYRDYIDRFASIAMEQQEAYRIPASVTLAQGLLESAAGKSSLAREANNHFGIKCHSDWKGATTLRDDDDADECFRAYDDPAESFEDHSRFLLRKRYAPLFDLDPSDYAGWARGLRQCGYATDPHYADKLITIIEKYALYTFDGGASSAAAEEMAEFIRDALISSHTVRRSRGLHYIVATPGDTYAMIAREFDISEEALLAFNDASSGEIRPWEEVYLEEKLTTAPKGLAKAIIGEDESIRTLSQRFGMKLDVLRALNPKAADRPGTRLRLK